MYWNSLHWYILGRVQVIGSTSWNEMWMGVFSMFSDLFSSQPSEFQKGERNGPVSGTGYAISIIQAQKCVRVHAYVGRGGCGQECVCTYACVVCGCFSTCLAMFRHVGPQGQASMCGVKINLFTTLL